METAPPIAPIYDELLDYLIKKATPEEILAFQLSEKAQERASYLLEGNNADELTGIEKSELAQLLHFDRLISVMKARAAKALRQT